MRASSRNSRSLAIELARLVPTALALGLGCALEPGAPVAVYDGPVADAPDAPGDGEAAPDEPGAPEEPSHEEPPPEEPAPTPDPTVGCERVRVVGTDGDTLNVRPGPDTTGAPVGTLAPGEIVDVIDVVEGATVEGESTWYEIVRGTLTGFITGRYASCVSDAPTAPGDSCGEGAEPQDWTWPVPLRHSVGQAYRNPSSYQTCGFHTGIDVGASIGDPILAAASGRIVHVGPMWFNGATTGRGPYAIIIQHAPGLSSTYGHNEQPLVAVGDCVSGGQRIADAGSRGYSSGPHLHFEMVRGEFTGNWQTPFLDACSAYRDPLDFVTP